MESAIRRLKMKTLQGILELSRMACAALENEYNQPGISAQKRQELYQRWDAVTKDSHAAQFELAVLERAEQDGYGDPDVLTESDF